MAEWPTHAGGSAFIPWFKLLPKLFNFRFGVKICQKLAKTFKRQCIGRQCIVSKDRFEIRRRAGDESEGHEPGKRRLGITQGMLTIKIAHRFRCRPMKRN